MKTIWKNIASRVWLIVTPIVLAIAITVNCLASITFYDAIGTVLGRATTKLVGEELNLYDKELKTKAEVLANGNRVSKEICEEGFVLLKNNGALPVSESETKVSVFGKNSVNMAMGGSGSGGGVVAETDIFDSLTDAGFTYNPNLVSFYKDDSLSGSGRSSNPSDLDSGKVVTLEIGETPLNKYSESLWQSCADYNDLAIIVITRIGGEGFDMPRAEDGTHSLQLTQDENDLIDKVTSLNFKKVLLVLNTATTVEMKDVQENDGIDSILWVGYTGGNGMAAFGEIIRGKTLDGEAISPTGRTVDTWAANFSNNPVWENFGAALGGDAYKTSTIDARTHREKLVDESVYFVDYEEGIYVGYRYYETAYAESVENGGYYDFVYDDEVVYPFGYGLTYTTFEWTLENADEVEGFVWGENTSLTFKVKVENTGDFPARDVVELYVTAPYYGTLENGEITGIEKSAKVLVGFAKTDIIAPNDSDTVEITVDSPYAFASYDYNDANGNGFKGYEAEAGTYTFTLGTDSHNAAYNSEAGELVFETFINQEGGFRYANDPVTGTAVVNQYTDNADGTLDSDYELATVLSRADFTGTWPASRTNDEKLKTSEWIAAIKSKTADPNRPEQDYTMPVTGKNNHIKLTDLIGVAYDDPLWEEFMDQLTLDEMTSLINNGAFHTEYISRLQVPQTTSSDGPVGFTNFIGAPEIYNTCVYPCEVVIASTWSVDRVYDMGLAVGSEGLVGNEAGDGAPYSGWYAPGLNIHRSPFCGRNFEYYSEDCFLSGALTAKIVEGCADKGVYVTMKHFALNEQETHRAINGVLTWATEQSMREIYLKGFEIAVKTAQKTAAEQNKIIPLGIMSSFNRIGTRWTGGDYRLLTTILRDEWGFRGLVLSDFNTCSHMIEKNMYYAGGDLDLQMLGIQWTPDSKSAADVTVAREAAKNVLFVVANSNAMRGEFRIIPPVWQIIMFVVDGVIAAGLAGWGAAVIIRAKKKSKLLKDSGVSSGEDVAEAAE